MWRRQEELGYWLTGDRRSAEKDLSAKRRTRLPRQFGFRQFRNLVKEQPLILETGTVSLDGELAATARVCDGLDAIDSSDDSRLMPEAGGWQAATHQIDLINTTSVRNLKLPDEQHVRIQQGNTHLAAAARTMRVEWGMANVHSMECYRSRSITVTSGERMLAMSPNVGAQITAVLRLPHMRVSLEIADLPDAERASFLREGEALKQLPADRAELVAIFRHVPIELISRLHYLAEKRIILYSVLGMSGRSQTRVHDMAAIRDKASQEILLVPHRARCRPVSLN